MQQHLERSDFMQETKTLNKCLVYGIARDWTGERKVFKCLDTSPCNFRRDFGGQPYCSDKVKAEPIKKETEKHGEQTV